MDFYAECEKRKEQRLGEIGQLSYQRYQAAVTMEAKRRQIEDLDFIIAGHEEAIGELERAQRNFNSYLAVKESAITTDQLAEGIRAAQEEESAPPGAGDDTETGPPVPAPDSEKKEAT